MTEPLIIVFPLYPGVTQLDFTGPYEVLARLPGARAIPASVKGGLLESEHGLTFVTERLADVPRLRRPRLPRLLFPSLGPPRSRQRI